MTGIGIANPGRSVAIAVGILVVGAVAVGAGTLMMYAAGHETMTSAALIGTGMLLTIFGLFATVNFAWAVRRVSAIRRGEGEIARWTVPPETLAKFRVQEASREGTAPNEFSLPKRLPPDGLEIVVARDAVVVGGAFFGLGKSGLAGFTSIALVPGDPAALAWGTRLTYATGGTVTVIRKVRGALRVPVARASLDAAAKVVAHYEAVLAGRAVVRPSRWRMWLGLAVAALAALTGAAGYLMRRFDVAPEYVATDPLMGLGALFFLAGAALALGGWAMARHDRAPR